MLRLAADERTQRTRGLTSRRTLCERAPHAALAALFTVGATLLLPFFPSGWPFLLGALAAVACVLSPRAGLALALAAPLLPLGNVSLGLALAYLPLALAWLLLFAREPRSGLLFLAGPLLAPLHALALVPLFALRARSALRRAVLAVAAVLGALVVAGLTRSPVPLTGDPPLVGLGLAGNDRPGAALDAVNGVLTAHPAVPLEAFVFALAAAGAPFAASRGLRWIAAWGALFLAAALLLPLAAGGGTQPVPLALGACVATAFLAYRPLRARR